MKDLFNLLENNDQLKIRVERLSFKLNDEIEFSDQNKQKIIDHILKNKNESNSYLEE